ncbi:hypothetical protein PCANC_25025 [Puccinia coronata f. sp. avenae]|uniref:Uncharacterized protein n=1 Tax=Puccinia coronata f. sp. avenae TaxID=200324 RepID=A0A2N5TMH7_9BASI|nr:hypothetical protein PCANC_25025 [Puccinia coronata f. sp. avenae]
MPPVDSILPMENPGTVDSAASLGDHPPVELEGDLNATVEEIDNPATGSRPRIEESSEYEKSHASALPKPSSHSDLTNLAFKTNPSSSAPSPGVEKVDNTKIYSHPAPPRSQRRGTSAYQPERHPTVRESDTRAYGYDSHSRNPQPGQYTSNLQNDGVNPVNHAGSKAPSSNFKEEIQHSFCKHFQAPT